MRARYQLLTCGCAIVIPALLGVVACGSSASGGKASSPPKALSAANSAFRNASRCDSKEGGRELSYHDLSQRGRPDMVEVLSYTKGTSGMSEGRVVCMELDTNHDGNLDLLRVFGDKGDLESEEADRNYDGKSDVWITYEKGVISKQAFDSNFAGAADEFHYYRDGKLKRIERDRNHDGKVDVWEFYVNNGVERMGVDLDFDGRVDTWYRDEVARAEAKKVAGASASASAAPSIGPAAPPFASSVTK